MTIKQLLQEANAIQIGIDATDWRQVIALAAEPLVSGGYLDASYPDAVIANTLAHGAYYVFEEGSPFPMRDRTRGDPRLFQYDSVE